MSQQWRTPIFILTARTPFISLAVTFLHFLHQLLGVNFPALSFSAIVLSAKVFVPSTNIWTIVSSKKRLKKSSGVEVVVNVILGPGCWRNGSGVGGVSIDMSLMGVQVLSMFLVFHCRHTTLPPLVRPLPHVA